ncbi:MAG: cell filamentation protein Fic, partial [Saprospiraceae bacterium]
ESFSAPRLDLIKWKSTDDHNVEILNDTADLYRYYDMTRQAEYLYSCVQDTIDNIIPEELDYLRRYDKTVLAINDLVTLPNNRVDLLIKMMQQNQGKLSKSKRDKFFDELSDEEVGQVELLYQQHFDNQEKYEYKS